MDAYIKEAVEKQLKDFDTLPFLFVGAGLSRRYLQTDSWEGLLEYYANISKDSDFGYRMYKEEVKNYETLVGENPKLASLIEQDFNKKWLDSQEYKDARERHKELALAGVSPFKIDIAERLINKQGNLNSDYEEEIKLFKELSSKHIAGVITTNYDTFLESCFEDYDVFIGQQELIFSVIQGIGEIYKIHGSVAQPESIVINENDYTEFLNRNAYLASKILTLFLEHPIIFIGYSINDPNVEEIMSSIVECLTEKQLELLKNRFIFVEWNNSDKDDSISTFQKSFKNGKRIDMTYVYIKDYAWFYKSLSIIQSKYKAPVLRKLKSQIYDLVISSEPSESLKVVNLEDEKLEDLEVVVGVGVIRDFAEKGYEGVSVKEIYEDVIFDNKNFDSNMIVDKALPTLLRRHNNSIPIYKYTKDYDGTLPEQIAKEKKTELRQFLNRGLINRSARIELETRSVEGVTRVYDLAKSLEYICLLKEEELNFLELKSFLQKTMTENPEILDRKDKQISTNFRRVVKIYDFLTYGE
ncbi:hypothetical protein GCM10011351_12620 [Paraliobacillus quinghaiensis]|uniref:SIR2-like domain-containing protein n=1 Tax=Paraliobacillus quinghaiensis TaxID=470815 RepID=A0A917WTM0_9BACI|nr:SIR2 family protein [Paraliobacillus quinghaiensis]GGM28188.1 hypothetical protein GCM10011351_12620 [Paraliobacillus quinghaiensis]